MTTETIADRRVHPGTIPIRLLKDMPSTLLGIPAGFAFFSDVGWLTILGIAAAAAVVGVAFIWLSWWQLRYGVGPSEIVIESGLFARTRRSIPFARVQDVDIERGPLQRLFGLAKVRIETGGGGKDEGLLDSITLAEADRVRAAVRAWRTGEAAAPSADDAAAPERGRLVFAMDLPRVLVAGLFNFSLVYLAGLFAALQSSKGWLPFDIYDPGRWIGLVGNDRFDVGHFTPAAIAAVLMLAVLIGVLFGIARTLLRDFGFRLWVEGERFRRERGLFTRSEVALPKRRVQLARLMTGPLRRRLDWSQLFFQTLGTGTDGGGHQVAAPLARDAEIARILAEQETLRLPRPEELAMVSSRHLWRLLIEHVLPWALLFAAATVFVPPGALLFLLLPVFLGIALLERRFHRYGLADDLLFIRRGVIRQQLWIVPVAKIQSLALRRNPLQRWLGLSTLAIDTAGAGPMGGPRIVDLREARSRALLADLSLRLAPAQLSGRKSGTDR